MQKHLVVRLVSHQLIQFIHSLVLVNLLYPDLTHQHQYKFLQLQVAVLVVHVMVVAVVLVV